MGYFGSSFTSQGTGVNIEICDVTLRDGEQAPGVVFGMEEKIEIATKLDSIGVEMIEAGFPAVSSKEKAMVKKIANLGLNTKISVSYTHLRAHETVLDLVCRLLLEKK